MTNGGIFPRRQGQDDLGGNHQGLHFCPRDGGWRKQEGWGREEQNIGTGRLGKNASSLSLSPLSVQQPVMVVAVYYILPYLPFPIICYSDKTRQRGGLGQAGTGRDRRKEEEGVRKNGVWNRKTGRMVPCFPSLSWHPSSLPSPYQHSLLTSPNLLPTLAHALFYLLV